MKQPTWSLTLYLCLAMFALGMATVLWVLVEITDNNVVKPMAEMSNGIWPDNNYSQSY